MTVGKVEYYFGFLDLTIREVYVHYPEFFEAHDLFITCLDSDPRVSRLHKWIKELHIRKWNYRIVGEKVWLSGEHTRELFEEGKTFSHFDEVYLLEGMPPKGSASLRIFTSDSYTFSKELPQAFLESFCALGARRYLSDGRGLNFACKSKSVAGRLRAIVEKRK